MDDLVDLIAPPGCDECNFDTGRYRVDNDGHVRVPREAVAHLIHVGGFEMAKKDPTALPPGMVHLVGVNGPKACSVGGNYYEPDEDGLTMVPAHAVAALCEAHDFMVPGATPALDPRDIELARLQAENDALKAAAEAPAKGKDDGKVK